jgi:phage-related protein
LHVFAKKTEKTPRRAIELAQQRWRRIRDENSQA